MVKPFYIKGPDGKMQGSIGHGKTDIPLSMPQRAAFLQKETSPTSRIETLKEQYDKLTSPREILAVDVRAALAEIQEEKTTNLKSLTVDDLISTVEASPHRLAPTVFSFTDIRKIEATIDTIDNLAPQDYLESRHVENSIDNVSSNLLIASEMIKTTGLNIFDSTCSRAATATELKAAITSFRAQINVINDLTSSLEYYMRKATPSTQIMQTIIVTNEHSKMVSKEESVRNQEEKGAGLGAEVSVTGPTVVASLSGRSINERKVVTSSQLFDGLNREHHTSISNLDGSIKTSNILANIARTVENLNEIKMQSEILARKHSIHYRPE